MESQGPQCAKCTVVRCRSRSKEQEAPASCPSEIYRDLVEETAARLMLPENQAINDAWVDYISKSVPPKDSNTRAVWTRLEEIMEYARIRKMKKIGIGTCGELLPQARLLSDILERNEFKVVSVVCLCGELDPKRLGVPFDRVCNPIMQAEVLNREATDLNIMLGLCLGHDILFLRNCTAETTPFVVKDRALEHNPVAALYLNRDNRTSDSFS